ncbi:MAG: ABC transporter permease [Betaproteobacteria bacterium]|nr:ABC transporter permease [Betaproteobacteria bacterium]MDH5221476.1 ABC transporter permease [Betaproteobacteria bacterium]MDH5351135.1 ABC transporter permease [Betaproteobacteria bacterium]
MSTMLEALLGGLRLVATLDLRLWEIVGLSLAVSLSAVLFASLIGLPLGAAIAVGRFPGRQAVIVVLNALMGLPPVVVGLFVYLLLSRAGPLGALGLLFTPQAMVIAQTVLVLPIIAALARQAVEDAWREYEEQLRSLGVHGVRGALTVLWDIRFSLLTAVLAGLGRASAEVGAVMIVGGNIDGVTRVMTTTIALETSKGDLPLALGLGIVLIVIVLALNAAAQVIKEAAQRRYG